MARIPQDGTDFWNGVYFALSYSSDNSVFNHLVKDSLTFLIIQGYSYIQNFKYCMFLFFSNLSDTFWRPTCGLLFSTHQGPESVWLNWPILLALSQLTFGTLPAHWACFFFFCSFWSYIKHDLKKVVRNLFIKWFVIENNSPRIFFLLCFCHLFRSWEHTYEITNYPRPWFLLNGGLQYPGWD